MSEPRRYTAGEATKLSALLAKGCAQTARGKSTAGTERAIDDLQTRAIQREQAEDKAREQAEAKRRQERAERKASRRFW